MHYGYFDTTRKGNHSVFWHQHWLVGDDPFLVKYSPKVTHLFCTTLTSQRKQVMFCAGLARRITTAGNCTMNFSGVGTAQHIRMVLTATAELLVSYWHPKTWTAVHGVNRHPSNYFCRCLRCILVMSASWHGCRVRTLGHVPKKPGGFFLVNPP